MASPAPSAAFPPSRLSALTGIAAVVLLAVGTVIIGTDFPTYDDSGREYAAFYADKSSTIELSVVLSLFGAAAFAWFAGFLRWAYGEAEEAIRGFHRISPIAFGAAVAGVAVSMVSGAVREAAVVAQGTVPAGVIRALDLLSVYLLTATAGLLTVFLLASLFLIRVTGVLPQWLGYVAMAGTVLGVLQTMLLLAPQDDDGVLGALGFLWFFVFLVWTFSASAVLTRRVT
jgi:hypothetical protein